jgi:hypothetical protein
MSSSEIVQESVSTMHVFERVAARLGSDEAARSLWVKLEQEMAGGGVPSATSYLKTRFKELSDRVATALPGKGQD